MVVIVELGSVDPESRLHLSEVARLVRKSRKAVIVTGAGISCNAGIPDFRSENGLYNLVKTRFPDAVIKGKDLFDTVLFSNEKSIKVFMSFMAELRKCILAATSTKTHGFIRKLQEKKKLLRCYTQNIDGLETQQGLTIGIPRVTKDFKCTAVVPLHGDIHSLRCMLCASQHNWTDSLEAQFQLGEAPACPSCQENQDERIRCGKRITGVGCLRPDIVLYGEEHPAGTELGLAMSRDIKSNPDLLLIMGTSLKVVGIRKLVRDMAKAVKGRGGKVVLINATDIGVTTAAWKDIIDYHVHGDCDSWVSHLKEEIPTFFELQSVIPQFMKSAKKSPSSKDMTKSNMPSPPHTPCKSKRFLISSLSNSPSPVSPVFDDQDSILSAPLTPLSQKTIEETSNSESPRVPLQAIINGSLKRSADHSSLMSPKRKMLNIAADPYV